MSLVTACAAQTKQSPASSPETSLSNGKVTLRLHLPDAAAGYYRGTRFDHSGLVYDVQYAGHHFMGNWQDVPAPLSHDCVSGPAGEFGIKEPLGYREAAVGGHFYKIGVGVLRKTTDKPYQFWTASQVVQMLPWKVDAKETSIRFEQILPVENGWGYSYVRQITLLDDAPGFEIRQTLRNTGTNHIRIEYYAHNFVIIDGRKIGPAYRITYPFDLSLAGQAMPGPSQIKGRTITFSADMGDDHCNLPLKGFRSPADNNVLLENLESHASIRIMGDRTPSRAALYAGANAACPEMFVELNIPPGKQETMVTTYLLETR